MLWRHFFLVAASLSYASGFAPHVTLRPQLPFGTASREAGHTSPTIPRCGGRRGVILSRILASVEVQDAQAALGVAYAAALQRIVTEVGFVKDDFANDILGDRIEAIVEGVNVMGTVESYRGAVETRAAW